MALQEKRFFAGIGSRETPTDILETMRKISKSFTSLGLTLRSGGAVGADTAFEEEALRKEIFRPEDVTDEALMLSERYCPHWKVCSPDARALLGRNSQIILGANLDCPVDFVVCWTKNAKAVGGTGQAIRVATAYQIPVYNLASKDDYENLQRLFLKLKLGKT